MSYHFQSILTPFSRFWYDIVVLFRFQSYRDAAYRTDLLGRLGAVRLGGTVSLIRLRAVRQDGHDIGRTRKDGSRAFVAQIVIKKGGTIVHREAETFDRKQAANAWIVKREAELKRPGGLDHKEDPTLAAVIDRYIAEPKNAVLGTKAQVLKTIKNSDLGEAKCSDITSHTLVSFARELTKNVEPQTCGNYSRTYRVFFTVARPAWGYLLSRQEFDDAVTVIKKLGLIRKGNERNRRPTLEELDWLMEHFGRMLASHGGKAASLPRHQLLAPSWLARLAGRAHRDKPESSTRRPPGRPCRIYRQAPRGGRERMPPAYWNDLGTTAVRNSYALTLESREKYTSENRSVPSSILRR